MSLIVRTLAYVAVVWLMMTWDNPGNWELESLASRIRMWRKLAEFCGRRVLKLEARHAKLCDAERMN